MASLQLIFTILFLLPAQRIVGQQPGHSANTLDIGRRLATSEFRGFTHGDWNRSDKTIDCTVFVAAVCTDVAKRQDRTLDETTRKAILMSDLTKDESTRWQAMIEASDARTSGVQRALVQAGLGTAVPTAQARVGDIVQVWFRRDGTWHGHAGIISAIDDKGMATIFGAHRTSLRVRADGEPIPTSRGGIGDGPTLSLRQPAQDLRVFVVRWSAVR